MANRHFGALGDVWKHLLLAEVLRLNPPRHYWETHAGSASYDLADSETRRHGAIRFLSNGPRDPDLVQCGYLSILREMPGIYPGSPLLAMRTLGRKAQYIFCDIDPESTQSLRANSDSLNVEIVEGDGVSAIRDLARNATLDASEVLVGVDPYDPHERLMPNSATPLELAASLARQGYRLFYWYGYDSIDEKGWAYREILKLSPNVRLWCGDVLIPSPFVYPGRQGAWGCGVVLANMTDAEGEAGTRLGRALERISVEDIAIDNNPARLTFAVIGTVE